MLDPDTILAAAAETLDASTGPIALILSDVLGHIQDYDQARSVAARLINALPSGSYLSVNDGSRGIDPNSTGRRTPTTRAVPRRTSCAPSTRSRRSSTGWSWWSPAWSR
ncbi:hypothetical protein STENM223S_07445 [Streptomyces tendae]